MTDRTTGLTRRRILASVGMVGAAGIGAGLGANALFGDSGEFDSATLAEPDFLEVGWEEHYYNGQAPPDNREYVDSLRPVDSPGDVTDDEVGLPDPEYPLVAVAADDLAGFMQANENESGSPEDDPSGIVTLDDVKPGDFGEVTFSYRLRDNPGYVTLEATVREDAENDISEPESDLDDSPDAGELGENVRAALWYDPDCDNVFDSEEAPLVRGTLDEVLAFLGANPPGSSVTSRDPLVLDPTDSGGRAAPDYPGSRCHRVVGDSVDCSERFYFTDVNDADDQNIFGTPDDDTTRLYEGSLEDTDGDSQNDRAEVTELFNFREEGWTGTYDHVVSIAASADGTRLYLIDKFSGHLGVYDLPSGRFEDRGEISGAPDRSLQSAVSPGGTLYFTVGGGTRLYTIENPDANNPTVDETIPLTDSNGASIEVGGSDIAFLSDGTLYLIDARVADSKQDLYRLPDPSTGQAEFVAQLPSEVEPPGIARAPGTESLVGNDSQNDQFYELDPADGSEVATYEMVEPGGAEAGFDQGSGDMTTGQPCPKHCVALAWWVPRGVGNEIQSDSYTFDLTFRAEGCEDEQGEQNTNLVNRWRLDSIGDGTAEDVVGGNDGTVQGNVTPATDAHVGTGAASFDGSSRIELPGFPDIQSSFTVSAWIRTNDRATAGQRIFADDENGTDGDGYALSLGDGGPGKLRLFSRALDSNGYSTIILDTGDVIGNDTWHHVVAVVDTEAKTRRIYVDGAEEASDSFSNEWGTDPGMVTIGGTSAWGFDGAIDDVRFYNGALSAQEVSDLYQDTL